MSGFGRLGGVYALLEAGHLVGDIWVQRDSQATGKGHQSWGGRWACASHVATLTATQAAFLAVGVLATGERLSPRRVAAGLSVNAASHYLVDRRWPLERLARLTGNHPLFRLGQGPFGSGAYQLDQAWHVGWCALTAAIIAGRSRS